MNKKIYTVPSIKIEKCIIETVLESISGGGDDNGYGNAESKRRAYYIDDLDDMDMYVEEESFWRNDTYSY